MAAPSVVVPTPEDLEVAKGDALLQLRIGRSAHYYAVVASAGLMFDGALVWILQPSLNGFEPQLIQQLFFLIFPLLGGLYLSIFGLLVKWEVYQLWPWEPHFSLTVAAVGANGLLTVLYFLDLFQSGPTGHWNLLPWFYPLSLAGMSLALVALALTWQGWGTRKVTALVAALLPIPIAFAVYVPANGTTVASVLGSSLFASAFFYSMSGSFLHLISSGTQVHEREVISSGQGRMFKIADELQQKAEALRFREASIVKREADAEITDDSLQRQRQSLDDARAQFEKLESDLKTRTEGLAREQQGWSMQVAETHSLRQEAEDQQNALRLREQEVETRLQKLSEREQSILVREGETTHKGVDLAQREQELVRRLSAVPELEARLESRRQEIERRTAELLQHEAALTSRESMMQMTEGERESTKDRLAALEERDARLNQLKIVLDEQNITLGRRSKQADQMLAEARQKIDSLAERENTVLTRESEMKRLEAESNDRLELATQRQQQYEDALHRFEERLRQIEQQEAKVGSRTNEVERVGATLAQREASVKAKEMQVLTQRSTVDRAQRELLERERAVQAREAEIALQRQELLRGGSSAVSERADFEARDQRIQLREARLNRKDSPLTAAPAAGDGILVAGAALERKPDRSPTGIPRLDDLLLGGIPPKGHVLLAGPPFSGKELVLYSFLVEGLQKGEPAIIITAARGPSEVGPEIGVVSPQFRGYEQMGQVRWIDATGAGTASGSGTPARAGELQGPGDLAGILSALVREAKQLETRGTKQFRVGFLGLSATLGHAEPKAGFGFLQNLVGILKPRPALALYAVDTGSSPDDQLSSIQGRMDGVIEFKQDRGKSFLSVRGLGDVQTRDWVEYRSTNRTLVIGSFALERIR
jgi:KaiC/GvpD/RAD55 family RecA-like ATPase